MSNFTVHTTQVFEKMSKKIIRKDKELYKLIEETIDILEENPYGENSFKIKKLTDIKQDDGKWRIRFRDYRIRYDIIGRDVILHSIRNRRDSYKNKK